MAFGDEANTGKINQPGTYRDPESGGESTVVHAAGADALVKLGWQLVPEVKVAVPEVKVAVPDSKKVAAPGSKHDLTKK